MCHDNCKGTTATSKLPAVSEFGLDVANNGAFWNDREGQDIANGQGSLLSTVNELTRVHAFCANEKFIVSLVIVGISELDLGNRCTATRVMQDFLDYTANVTMLLGVVQGTELDGSLAGADMCLEDRGLSLALGLFEEKKDVTV